MLRGTDMATPPAVKSDTSRNELSTVNKEKHNDNCTHTHTQSHDMYIQRGVHNAPSVLISSSSDCGKATPPPVAMATPSGSSRIRSPSSNPSNENMSGSSMSGLLARGWREIIQCNLSRVLQSASYSSGDPQTPKFNYFMIF